MARVKNYQVFTKAGQVMPAVREALRTQVKETYLADWTTQPDGTLTIDLGTKEGRQIKAAITLTITTKETFERKTKSNTKAEPAAMKEWLEEVGLGK